MTLTVNPLQATVVIHSHVKIKFKRHRFRGELKLKDERTDVRDRSHWLPGQCGRQQLYSSSSNNSDEMRSTAEKVVSKSISSSST